MPPEVSASTVSMIVSAAGTLLRSDGRHFPREDGEIRVRTFLKSKSRAPRTQKPHLET